MSATGTVDSISGREGRRGLAIVLCLVALFGLVFIVAAALPYYRMDPASFRGYWPRRWWLLTHITTASWR